LLRKQKVVGSNPTQSINYVGSYTCPRHIGTVGVVKNDDNQIGNNNQQN